MRFDLLYNFISPITGKIKIDSGYTLIGDKDGFSSSSPILIDIRQDIVDLRRKLSNFNESNKLDNNRIWIGNYLNEREARLQIGVINLPTLTEAVFPNPLELITGDLRIPNPTFDYSSVFDRVMSGPFLPQTYATKYNLLGNPVGVDVSSSLAMTQVKAAQIMKRFDNANFIVGSSTIDFNWENPKMALIPEQLKQLYGLGTNYTFTKAQSLGDLETGLLKNTVDNNVGTLSKAISGEDYVNTADFPIGNLVILDPLYPTSNHKLISPTTSKFRKNISDEFGKVKDTINVLETEYLAVKNLSVDNTYFIDIANTVGAIANTVNILDNWLITVTGINKIKDAVSTATKVTDIIKSVGDVANTSVNAFAKTSSVVSTATGVATTASLQAQIGALTVALTGIETEVTATAGMAALGSVLNFAYTTILGIFTTAVSINYIDRAFVEKRPLLSENKFYETDNLGSWGKGNIWYDCDGSKTNDGYRGGLRVTAWDSSWFLGSLFENELVPLSIGVFGYKWTSLSNPKLQQGFVWEAAYENNSNHANYRFPKKFSLRDVGHQHDGAGWNVKDNELMNFDLYQNKFTFERPVKFNNNTEFDATVKFNKNIILPIIQKSEIPINPPIGMLLLVQL